MVNFAECVVNESSSNILCFYINITSRIQFIRVTNIPNSNWEKVVFPGQRLIFEAMTSALLEIRTSESVTAIPADVISCEQLRITNESTLAKHSL